MRVFLLLVPLAALSFPAAGASVETPKDAVACQLEGWSSDPDPAGLNLRAGPSAAAPVIARLFQRTGDAQGPAPELKIVAFKAGWFLVEGAHYGDYGDPPPKTPPYAGPGWAHGSKLAGELLGAGETLRTAPDAEAPKLSNPHPGEAFQVRALLACQGEWVKVQTPGGAGWAHGLCSNQVTTCN